MRVFFEFFFLALDPLSLFASASARESEKEAQRQSIPTPQQVRHAALERGQRLRITSVHDPRERIRTRKRRKSRGGRSSSDEEALMLSSSSSTTKKRLRCFSRFVVDVVLDARWRSFLNFRSSESRARCRLVLLLFARSGNLARHNRRWWPERGV